MKRKHEDVLCGLFMKNILTLFCAGTGNYVYVNSIRAYFAIFCHLWYRRNRYMYIGDFYTCNCDAMAYRKQTINNILFSDVLRNHQEIQWHWLRKTKRIYERLWSSIKLNFLFSDTCCFMKWTLCLLLAWFNDNNVFLLIFYVLLYFKMVLIKMIAICKSEMINSVWLLWNWALLFPKKKIEVILKI